jgi:epoxyqueuosine reductase
MAAELPLTHKVPGDSPCASWSGKPCTAACPVGAVQPAYFDVDRRARYRLRPQSTCPDRCLAWLACPYFPEHRYSLAQIQYHYGRSLETLRVWYEDSAAQ